MINFFVRPWEICDSGNTIEVQGEILTHSDVRRRLYENIVDEVIFIARASEGAVTTEWLMEQPIFVRKKYVKSFTEELKKREEKSKSKSKNVSSK
jgi:hypothetical protein